MLERVSLLLLVGGILFEIVTGLLNIQYDYVFGFDFYTAHYFGAWVFIGAFVAHVALKLPHMLRGAASRSLRAELRTPLAETRPEETDDESPGWSPRIPPADAEPARRAGARRRRGGARGRAHRRARPSTARCASWRCCCPAAGRPARAATASRSTRRAWPPGHPGRATGRGLAAGCSAAEPRSLDRDELLGADAAHRAAADRLCGGLVDRADLDRRAAARPGGARRRPGPDVGGVRLGGARRRSAGRLTRRPGVRTRTRCSRCASTART